MNRLLFTTIIVLGMSVSVSGTVLPADTGATGQETSRADQDFHPLVEPTLHIHQATGNITIDGDLSDPGWQDVQSHDNFSEIEPGDQTQPPVRTEFKVTYDQTNLYISFHAFDDPSKIRASLQDRDEAFGDDWVGLILDTYGDATWGYEVFANPHGVQMDGRFTQDYEDMGFDIVFQSEGKITADGYQVEFAFPFRSLRFPTGAKQYWHVTFLRNHPRDSRGLYSWAAIDRDNPCALCQLGSFNGLENIESNNNLEFFPEAITTQSGQLADDEDPSSGFLRSPWDGALSLGVKYGITSDLTADLALNPDFSQVEADPAQIDVNSTFSLYFQERRPFFMEGSDLFNTYLNTVYTRSINNPSVATKLTGRLNKVSIAYIGARDEQSPVILPFEEQSTTIGEERHLKSYSNIIRLKRPFNQDSFVGALVTDRRLDLGGSGSLITTDGSVRFLQNYRLDWQFAASHTAEPNAPALTEDVEPVTFNNGRHTSAFDGEQFWGRAIYTNFQRSARHLNFDLDYQELGPNFRAANGFITSNNLRHIRGGTQWMFYPEGKFLERWSPGIRFQRNWNLDGVRKRNWVSPYLWGRFTKQTYVNIGYNLSSERFQGIEFSGMHTWDINLQSNFSDPVSFYSYASFGRSIARNEDIPKIGKLAAYGGQLTIKPLDRLILETSFNSQTMRDLQDNSAIFSGYIVRNRLNFQFNRNLFLRLVTQYNQFDDAIQIDPLITYRINAFSAIYLGSTHNMQEFDGRTDFTQTSRQFFLKVKYLFQL